MALITIKENKQTEPSTIYTLHPYDHRFDAGLARMWNESDDQWPGTFTDGVPLTEERVREWMDDIGAVMRLVVVRESDKMVVGYGDLWDDMAVQSSCYVALLNVHPDHQGKSLARRMLHEMVNWSVENGYHRMTIGTWPANLKAMPLYKKVGFFWEPDTSVHMENYVPAVRLLPAVQDYFERYDWYRTYDRELKQVEDDMQHPQTGDMKVYILRWDAGESMVEAVFDRNAQALTGLETDRWAVYARVGSSEPAQGKRYPLAWFLKNKTDAPLQVSLEARGDEGIEAAHKDALTLAPGEERVLETRFSVATDAPKFQADNHELPTPRITTSLQINGQNLELACGLRYRQAVSISLEPEVVSLLPGQAQTVLLQIENRVNSPLSGQVHLSLPEGVSADWQDMPFSAEARGFAGIPVRLTAGNTGFYPLQAAVSFEDDGETVTTKAALLPVTALAVGGVVAGKGDEELILENDFFRVTCRAKSGEAVIWNKAAQAKDAALLEELGLPYVPWDLYEQTYELDLDFKDGTAKAVMTVHSTRFPGTLAGRELVITASPVIKHRNWVSNNSDERCTGLKIRPAFRLNERDHRYVAVPLDGQVVREHASDYGDIDGDLPEKPEAYTEPWIAFEQPGQVFGTVWAGDAFERIMSRRGDRYYVSAVPALAPGETFYTRPVYVYSGPGTWHTVQALWKRLQGKPLGASRALLPAADRHLNFSFLPEPLVTLEDELTASLYTRTTRELKVYGSLAVTAPEGWEVDQEKVKLVELDKDHPLETAVSFKNSVSRVGAGTGKLRLNTQGFDTSRPFTLLRLGLQDEQVQVEKSSRSGYEIWQLANGHSEWSIAPAFGGSVVSWQEIGASANHLRTGFPEAGELSWMKPWFGGIRPCLHDFEADTGWPGKLHEEKLEAAPVEAADSRGLPWQGVRLSGDMQREVFRGLRVEVDYLTLGGSNVLKVVYRLFNDTSVSRKAEPALMSFLQVDGTHANAVVHGHGDYQRKRIPGMAWVVHGAWAAVQNAETGRAVAAVMASGWKRTMTMDWGRDGGHVYAHEPLTLKPQSSSEMVMYYALAASLEEARRYEALKEI